MNEESNEEWQPYVINRTEHPGVSIKWRDDFRYADAKIAPSGFTVPHNHSGEEKISVIHGRGVLLRDNQEIDLMPGCIAIIPANVRHSVKNVLEIPLELSVEFTPSFREQETKFID